MSTMAMTTAADTVTPSVTADQAHGYPADEAILAPTLRVAALGVVGLMLLAVAVGTVAHLPVVRGTAVAGFLLAGVGVTPCLLVRRPMTPATFLVMALATSLAFTTTIGFGMAELQFWHPTALFVAVVIATLLGAVPALARSFVAPPGRAIRPVRQRSLGGSAAAAIPNTLAVAGLVVCALVAGLHRGDPHVSGLWRSAGPGWYVGIAMLVAGAVCAWRRATSPAGPVVGLGIVVVLSQAIAYRAPTSMTAARHVGVVNYVLAHHKLDPSADIYQAWAGLFTGAAWLCSVGGIHDPMTLATWWPVLLSGGLVLAVRVLAERLSLSPGRAWAAALLFGLANTLNITFFAPQALGIFLAIVIFGLALAMSEGIGSRRSQLALILWLSSVMAVVHQISPYLTVAALVALVIFRRLRPWWLPGLVLLPAAAWAVVNHGELGRFISIGAIGHIFDNARPPTHSGANLGDPLVTRLTFDLPTLVLVVIGLAALATVAVRRNRANVGLLIAAASPVSLFFATGYGQEGVFRVALFALPWLAVLAAALPFPKRLPGVEPARLARLGNGRWPIVAGAAGIAVLILVNAFGQTALDWARVVRPDEAAATRQFELTAPLHSALLSTGAGDATPSNISRRYLDVDYLSRQSLADFPNSGHRYDATADVRNMTQDLRRADPRAPAYYALVSNVIGGYDADNGYQSEAEYRQFTHAMAASPLWQPVRTGPTTTLYRLTRTTQPSSDGTSP
jgi:hypothetical protein